MSVRFILAVGVFAWLISACSDKPRLHMTSQPPAAPADIRFEGDSGSVSWSWGHGDRKERIIAVEDRRFVNRRRSHDATLQITLEDGTVLRFVPEHTFYICQAGCDAKHIPVTWVAQEGD